MEKLDYKKEYKDFYMPKTKPVIVEIPQMNMIRVKGKGNPNVEQGEYQKSIQILYGINFTIKMSKRGSHVINGYHDYVVPPLEGLWWMEGIKGIDDQKKDQFSFYSMMRLPDFVDQDVFDWAVEEFCKKHQEIDISQTEFISFEEGLCVQMLHKGAYDEEPKTVEQLHRFVQEQGYVLDYDGMSPSQHIRKHHEIYLSDPRRCKPENLKTVIRLPIRRSL